jgi:elongation of very long chain fatty acids protein 4
LRKATFFSKDPRLENWWTMDTPVKPILIMMAYWIVLLAIKYYMKDRQPFELRYFLIAYNFVQVCGSFYIALEVSRFKKIARSKLNFQNNC